MIQTTPSPKMTREEVAEITIEKESLGRTPCSKKAYICLRIY